MDDLLTSQPTVEQATSLALELIELLKTSGFRLTKWASNSRQVLSALPSTELAKADIDLDLDEMPVQRILGMRWDTNTDEFTFRTVKTDAPLTKRGVIRIIATLFDPLGFLSPFVFIAKRLMQELWLQNVDWDDPLPEPQLRTWKLWLQDRTNVTEFRVPRCYTPDLWFASRVELHIFADASEVGFGAVAYIRVITDSSQPQLSFVFAKTRNAPLKKLTIPRLELQAAVLASRMYTKLKTELSVQFNRVLLWSDSTTALQYIKNTSRRFHCWTANRVQEILQATDAKWWMKVPTHLNPADDCSKGVTATELLSPGHRFISGPNFLRQPEYCWPVTTVDPVPSTDPEVKPDTPIIAAVTEPAAEKPEPVLDPTQYSRLLRLTRVTSWIRRFRHNTRVGIANKTLSVPGVQGPKMEYHTGPLSPCELDDSLMYWVKQAQSEEFAKEISSLKRDKLVHASSPLRRLQPEMDGDLLRVGGRLHRAPLPYDARHQLLLPNKHHVSDLLIRDAHEKTGHAGQEAVLAFLRQRFWIVKARVPVRRLTRTCIVCIRRRSTPVVPAMSPLPESRLALDTEVWSSTGVDYCGPVYVIRGRGREKRWICLFTCLTTRAVHLELANSLDTDAFILALKRFTARRGCPTTLSADNGTNFRGAARELAEQVASMDHNKIADQLSAMGIEWRFNPPAAPHFGGSWERLNKSLKSTLSIVLGGERDAYHEDVLHTALVETEAIINSRPLTATSDDPDDLCALTPNHFLIGRADPRIPPAVPIIDCKNHRKRWKRAQNLRAHLWSRFRREYIPELTTRNKWFRSGRNLKPNDLVIVTDDQTPRYKWSLARVLRPLPGKDGKVRVAEIKTPSGILVRPVARLCLLEESQS